MNINSEQYYPQKFVKLVLLLVLCIPLVLLAYRCVSYRGDNPLTLYAFALVVPGIALWSFLNLKQGLYLLCILIPLSFEIDITSVSAPGIRTALSRSSQPISLSSYDLILGSLFLSLILRRACGDIVKFRMDRIFKLLMLFGAAALVSLILAYNKMYFIQWKVCFLYLLKLLEVFLVYFIVINVVETNEEVVKLIRLSLTAAIALCVVTLYNLYLSSQMNFMIPISIDRISYFGFLILSAPIALALLFNRERSENSAKLILIVILSIVLVSLSFKRALIFAIVLSFLFLGLALKKLYIILPTLAIYILIFSLTVKGFTNEILYSFSYNRVDSSYTFGSYSAPVFQEELRLLSKYHVTEIQVEPAAAERVMKWTKLLRHFPKNPIFGVGYWAAKYRIGMIPHNIFVAVLVEMGLMGFILFLFIIKHIFQLVWSLYKSSDDELIKSISIGFVASIMGVLAIGLTAEVFFIYRLMASFWLILGLLSQSYKFIEQPSHEI